jgi:hypothetical protein
MRNSQDRGHVVEDDSVNEIGVAAIVAHKVGRALQDGAFDDQEQQTAPTVCMGIFKKFER